MSDEVTKDPAVGLYFSVSIDGVELGSFSTCEGLSVEVQTEDREEGGENGFVHKLPVRMKYSNIKFTRPIGPDSKSNGSRAWRRAFSGPLPPSWP